MIKKTNISLFVIVLLGSLWVVHLSASSTEAIDGQSQTLLPDGRILLLGGIRSGGNTAGAGAMAQDAASPTVMSGRLKVARAWHSATLLPNGKVLVFGGIDSKKSPVGLSEIFDPVVGRVTQTFDAGLTPRSNHTATLLINGTVLFVGGVDKNNDPSDKLELWDSQSHKVSLLPIRLHTARFGHTATLQADGSVLIWGGVDSNGSLLPFGEVIDPVSMTVRTQATQPESHQSGENMTLMESLPTDGAVNVSLSSIVSFRFSKPINVTTATTTTATLSTNGVPVPIEVVPAEGGTLLFLTPQVPLLTGTVYTASLNGLTAASGEELGQVQISFTTVGLVAGSETTSTSSVDRTGQTSSQLPLLKAPTGVTALSGRVLAVSGSPLVHTLIEIGTLRTYTDAVGRFLLQGVTAGHHMMLVDGAPANTKTVTWGLYRIGVDLVARNTTALKYTIWMTPLDTRHVVRFTSPTTSEVVVTNPSLPGLEVRIPAHTIVKDARGRLVTQLSVTPISVSKPPFPLRPGAVVPVYFTLQPGGASFITAGGSSKGATNSAPAKGVQIYYQNAAAAKAGARFNFFSYDPLNKGWFVYGKGHVSNDKNSINPDPGTQIWAFDGTLLTPADGPPAVGSNDCSTSDGDSVDLLTGLYTLDSTDLSLLGSTPLSVSRSYRPGDGADRSFGVGSELSDNMYLSGDDNNFPEGWTYLDLNLADGSRVNFTRVTPCDADGRCICDQNTTLTYVSRSDRCHYGATITHFCPPPPMISTNSQAGDGSQRKRKSGIKPMDLVADSSYVMTMADGTKFGFPDFYDYSEYSTPRRSTATSMSDRNGNYKIYDRDNDGSLLQLTGSNGRSIQFTYDTNRHISTATDTAGRSVSYSYDAQGRLSSFTDAAGFVTQYTYDGNDNLKSVIKPDQKLRVTNLYDQNGRVSQQLFPDGSTYQFSYVADGNGNIAQTNVTDPSGSVRQVTFNSEGHLTSDTVGLGTDQQEATIYELQPVSGLVLSDTDALGRTTKFTYDNLGETTSATKLAGTPHAVTTYYGYPPLITLNGEPGSPTFGNPTSVTDPLGNTTQFAYDGLGNVQAVTDPLGNVSSMTYDSAGQVLTQTDALGNTTHFSYDSGDLVQVTDPLGRVSTRFVDASGMLLAATDPAGHTTRYTYTQTGEILTVTDPLGDQTGFTYYPNGTLHTVTDANQHTTSYIYDNMDRLQTRQDPLGNSENYQYDANGRLQRYTDRRGMVTQYSYDSVGHRAFAGFGYNGLTYDSTIQYTFDGGNHLTEVLDSLTGTIHRSFDGLDGLLSETTPQGTVSYSYDNDERRQTMTVAGQPTIHYTFDSASRLTQITQGGSEVSFTYDPAGRRSALTLPNGVTAEYGYDMASELTSIQYQNGSAMLGDLQYSYDPSGRRTGVTGSLARTNLPNAVSGSYNQNNQLTQWASVSASYDMNGNVQNDGTNSYNWNSRDQLASMNSGSGVFVYDSFGRRVLKNINGNAKTFLYDGANVVQELQGGNATANLLTGSIDEIFARSDSSGSWSLLQDGLGSTTALTNSNGQIQTQYTYGPFGATTLLGTTTGNVNAYTGRELDETGLYYYRARYYNPNTGRFLSEDPTELLGGVNSYRYVNDNPIDLVDPRGLEHAPGGPWHPYPGFQFACKWSDDCATLSWKIELFDKLIDDHTAWDKTNKTNRHDDDIQTFQNGRANCVEIHQSKCTGKCPKFQPDPSLSSEPSTKETPLFMGTIGLGTVALWTLGFLFGEWN